MKTKEELHAEALSLLQELVVIERRIRDDAIRKKQICDQCARIDRRLREAKS